MNVHSKMPEIELLPSSSDLEQEDESEVCYDDSSVLDTGVCHPAAWSDDTNSGNGSMAYRHFEVFLNHPAAVRLIKRDAKKASRFKLEGNEKFKVGDFHTVCLCACMLLSCIKGWFA